MSGEGDGAGERARPRLRGLDALRALAVLLVIGRHMDVTLEVDPARFGPLLAAWQRGGWLGVDLFFVLSGFLVSGLIFDEHARTGGFRPLRFLVRRGFKIYPALWVMLGARLLHLDWLGQPFQPAALLHELLFVQNYRPGLWHHTWSLAVEEHFYLLLAGLLWALARSGRARPFGPILTLAGLALLGCLAGRVYLIARGASWTQVYCPTHLRVDALLCGAALRYQLHVSPGTGLDRLVRAHPLRVGLAGAALLVPFFLLELERDRALILGGGLTVITLGAGLLVLASLHGPAPAGPLGRLLDALAWVGAHSYSIYIWHLAAGVAVHAGLVRWWPARPFACELGAYVAVSVLGGVALAKLIELPALRLRERWAPAASRPSTEDPPRAPG